MSFPLGQHCREDAKTDVAAGAEGEWSGHGFGEGDNCVHAREVPQVERHAVGAGGEIGYKASPAALGERHPAIYAAGIADYAAGIADVRLPWVPIFACVVARCREDEAIRNALPFCDRRRQRTYACKQPSYLLADVAVVVLDSPMCGGRSGIVFRGRQQLASGEQEHSANGLVSREGMIKPTLLSRPPGAAR
jgi:hypothetical protein